MSTVVQIRLSLSNSFLVLGERPILVDTGSPKDGNAVNSRQQSEARAMNNLVEED